MNLSTSYRNIFNISLPIMIGGASQNIIALTDSVFLYHYDRSMFAAMGLVGVFYLIIAAIGYGFSRGGQILIARKMGEKNKAAIGQVMQMMILFELGMALILFYFMREGSQWLFSQTASSPVIIQHCVDYMQYRSYGVFFSYIGVVFFALYAGVARGKIIMHQTLILILINLVLNYGFIFGHFGLPEMGIKGAALASTLAEAITLIVFLAYVIIDNKRNQYHLWNIKKLDFKIIKHIILVSVPFVMQNIVGLGSAFLLFSWIENLGERQLAISNLGRVVYLILSIPIWGYASGIQTLVSGYIGNNKSKAVVPIIIKTAKLSLFSTSIISVPFLLFPQYFLYPLLGSHDMSLINDAQQVFVIILILLIMFSVTSIFFNGLGGTGASLQALYIQISCTILYLAFTYYVVKIRGLGLNWAWGSEALYWILQFSASVYALLTYRWKTVFD